MFFLMLMVQQRLYTINNVTSISDWENLNLAERRIVQDTSVSNVHSAAVELVKSFHE